jgi:L-ascorbate metabolism protein UlaG (beta-lactamase superfamily)
MSNLQGTRIIWLGHATVEIHTAKGTSILIDPFIEHNPKYPKGHTLPEKLDLMLITHGHSDHMAEAVSLGKKQKPAVVAMVELGDWLGSKGVENVTGMNLGGSYRFQDVVISMVEARHSSGIEDGGKVVYGGVPVGFVIAVDNGPILYHAGDTSVFGDMRLIGELYGPELGILPIGDHYTMGPKAAAMAAKFLGIKKVLPIHFGTFPVLTGTPDQLESYLEGSGIEVLKVAPGQQVE